VDRELKSALGDGSLQRFLRTTNHGLHLLTRYTRLASVLSREPKDSPLRLEQEYVCKSLNEDDESK